MGELKQRLGSAVMNVNQNMLLRSCNEIAYICDVYFVINSPHNERLPPHDSKFGNRRDYPL
jgi:hypothetical protein